jgi:hypothetical protein
MFLGPSVFQEEMNLERHKPACFYGSIARLSNRREIPMTGSIKCQVCHRAGMTERAAGQ